MASNIVSVNWLKENHNNPQVIILDATMKKMPNGDPIPTPEVKITGAREFNFDTEICDLSSELPHMLPTADEFETAAREIGINQDSIIVCYDAMGIFSSPRAWWMFKVFGHKNVAVLDGGLPNWEAQRLPVQNDYTKAKMKGNFSSRFNSTMVFSAEQVVNTINADGTQIIDARSHGRFNGTEPEPRQGLRVGHIPSSWCLPFTELLDNGCFKTKEQLANKLQQIITNNQNRLVFSCGSGVTASVLALAADEVGYQNLSVYDGSWSEWGAREDLPIE